MSNPTKFGTNALPDLDERAEFEAAQRKYHWPLAEADLRQDKIGNYYNHTTQANWAMWQTRAALARRAQPEGEAPQAEHRVVIEEAAQVFESGAAHNRKAGRTVFAHAQQDRANRLRAALVAPAAQHAESGAQAKDVIEMLLEVAYRAWNAMDEAEETRGGHVVENRDFDALSAAMDKLDELPDDQPGYTMDAAAKARWALRHILAAQSQGAQALPPFTVSRYSDTKERGVLVIFERKITDDELAWVRAALATKAEAPASGDRALLAALAEAADVFMKGGVAPLRPLIDRAKAVAGAAQQAAAPGAEPGPWQVLTDDIEINGMRQIDVVLKNGVQQDRRWHTQIDWTQVADWRYSAPGTPEAPKGGA